VIEGKRQMSTRKTKYVHYNVGLDENLKSILVIYMYCRTKEWHNTQTTEEVARYDR